MAVYSFVGFSSACLAPLIFGMVLDVAGGNRSLLAWGLAFASIGIFGVLSPVARWIYLRRATPDNWPPRRQERQAKQKQEWDSS
jgi:MFS family permease